MTRLLAWQILRSGATAPTREVNYAAAQAGIDGRDRAFVRHLVYTEARRRGTLQAIVRAFATGNPSRDLTAHLRLGLAQILYMNSVPARAAVSEQVRATSETLGLPKGRYVNAVLRSVLRASKEGYCGDPQRDLPGADMHLTEIVFSDPEYHPLMWFEDALSFPAQLAKGWIKRYGREEAERMATDTLEDPRISLRVVRGTRDELSAELEAAEIPNERGTHPSILTTAPNVLDRVLRCAAFEEGRVTIQGEAALRAAELCGAKEGEQWLDLCAAPGGKTAVLAGSGAQVKACDISPEKVERLVDTCGRLGLAENVEGVVLEEDYELPSELQTEYDGVLLDVPCSNTGVLARRPDARWRWGPKSRKSLAEAQQALLERGAARVRPGGKLVYSTCSLEPDENKQRVRHFLETHPGWTLEEQSETLPRSSSPTGPVDGGFAARLVREG